MPYLPRTVVLVPAYNEEKTIAKVVVGVKKRADTVLVCDDGSSDMTAEIAEAVGARVIRHEGNLGKGAAMRTLIEEARKLDPEVVVTLDADGQHEVMELPEVVAPVLRGEADIVVGVRSTAGAMPTDRLVANRVLDEATSRKAGMKLEDTQSGFRAYSRRALAALDFKEKGMATESQTLIDAAHAGLRIVGVPVSTIYDGGRAKRSRVAHFSEVLDFILVRTVVDSPLLYLGVPGLLAVLVGVAAGLWVVNTFFETRLIATGTALISAILVIIGVILLATALILKFLKVQLTK